MSLRLLLFTRLSLKIEPSKRAGTKTEFDMKIIASQGHSRSFILQ